MISRRNFVAAVAAAAVMPKKNHPPLLDMRMEHNKGAKCIFAI